MVFLKLSNRTLIKASALFILVWSALGPTASAKPDDVWVLLQHGEEQGNTTIYISHDAVKVINQEHGCQLLTRAPDWKVHCYRPKDKVEWIGNMTQFNGIMMVNPFAMPKKQGTGSLKEIGKGSFKGLKYTKYRTPKSHKDILCTADDIAVAPMAAEFLARLFCTPYKPNVPLFRLADKGTGQNAAQPEGKWIDMDSMKDLRGGMVTKLATTDWHREPYNAGTFALPQGYKRIMDIIQISYSKNDKGQVNDMLKDIGFTSEAPNLVGGKKH